MNRNKIGSIFLVSLLALSGIGISYAGWTDSIYVTGNVSTGDVDINIVALSGTWVWKIIDTHELVCHHEWVGPNGLDPAAHDQDGKNSWYDYPDDYELVAYAVPEIVPGPGNEDKITVIYNNLFPGQDFIADAVLHYEGSIPARVEVNMWGYTITGQNPNYDWVAPLIVSKDIMGRMYRTTDPAGVKHPCDMPVGETVGIGTQIHECNYIKLDLKVHLPQQDNLMNRGCTITYNLEVKQWNEYVPIPPVAIGNGPFSAYQGIPITFDGSASYDTDGNIVLYEWDFDGDGIYDYSSTTTGVTTYAYPTGGNFNPVLRVTDDDLLTSIYTTTATIDYYLYDDFNDNNLDTSKWTTDVVGASNTFTETNQEAQFTTFGHYGWDYGHAILRSKVLTFSSWNKITISTKFKFTDPYTAEMQFLFYGVADPTKAWGIAYQSWGSIIRYHYDSTYISESRSSPTSYVTFKIVLFSDGTVQYWENGVKLKEVTSSYVAGTNSFKLCIGGWDYSTFLSHMYFDDISVTLN